MNTLRLIAEDGGETIEITADRTQIGRDPGSDVHLRNASVSRQHAVIDRNADEWVITDRKSGNGVLIDGARTSVGVLLPGQRLQIGTVRFRVEIDRGDDGATVILGRSPLLDPDADATLIGSGPFDGPTGAGGAAPQGDNGNRKGLLVLAGVIGLVVIAALLMFLVSKRESDARERALLEALAAATPTVAPPTPTPEPPTPTPTPVRRTVTRPQGSLLISTDTDADLLIDGRGIGRLRAGRMRSVRVSPGEHIVSFRIGKARHDHVARVKAREQAVVRFQRTAPAQPPSPDTSPSSEPPPPPTQRPALPFVNPVGTPPLSGTPQAVPTPSPAR